MRYINILVIFIYVYLFFICRPIVTKYVEQGLGQLGLLPMFCPCDSFLGNPQF